MKLASVPVIPSTHHHLHPSSGALLKRVSSAFQYSDLTASDPMSSLLSLFTHITVHAIIFTLLVLLASIGCLVLLPVIIIGRAFSTAARGGIRLLGTVSGLLQDELENLPSTNFNSGDSVNCVVCLEGLQAGERCRKLPRCGHVFHVDCADAWLLRAAVCPLCRTAVGSGRKVVERRVGL